MMIKIIGASLILTGMVMLLFEYWMHQRKVKRAKSPDFSNPNHPQDAKRLIQKENQRMRRKAKRYSLLIVTGSILIILS